VPHQDVDKAPPIWFWLLDRQISQVHLATSLSRMFAHDRSLEQRQRLL
jgi:hypothetical protein